MASKRKSARAGAKPARKSVKEPADTRRSTSQAAALGRFEEATARLEERYRAVVDSMAEMVCRFRPDGTILFVNGAYASARGTTPDALIGRNLWDFIAPADRAGVRELVDSLTPESPEVRIENRFETVDGERWTLWTNRGLAFDEAGRLLEAQSAGVDITDRKRAEESLRQSEERFRSLVSVITDVPWVTNAEGEFTAPQPAWEAYTGQVFEQHKGFSWADALHPDDRARVAELWRRACESRTTYESRGRLWHAPSKQYRHFVARATPLLNSDGSVREWVGSCTDVDELVRSNEALKESDRRKDEFLATLSHELRNPLAPLRNSLQLLRLAGNGSAATAPILEMMERQVNHLVRLVDDLLEMSRISRGAFELRREPVEVAVMVRNAIETSQPLIEAARHQLEVFLPEESLWVHGDPVRLAQVLANLLNNAAKYTPPGGRISVRVARDVGCVSIAVRDNGPGIEPASLPRMFEMFSRGDRLGREGGLGIGLALSRRLAELHGGSVDAASEGRGTGCEFTVRLPLATPPAHSETPARGEHSGMAQRRILVVDDNRDAADSLGMLLRFLGADVSVVHDGPAALRAFDSYDPAVVLLDIGMPEMDGYEVARQIRTRHPERHATLVALTGWGQEGDRRRAREAGFDHHLVKPADIGALQALLRSVESRQGKAADARDAL